MTPQKKSRNKVYRLCAVVMALALLEIALSALVLTEAQQDAARTTLVGEAIALVAFGVAWLIKGETQRSGPRRRWRRWPGLARQTPLRLQ